MKVIDVTKSLPVRRALLGLPRNDVLANGHANVR